MTLSKSEATPKPQENSNTEDMKDQQTVLNELASGVKSGTKPKFQTKICDHWKRSGSCSYGDACWYAHGEDDLRKVSMPRNHRLAEEKAAGENFYGIKEDSKIKPSDDVRTSPPPKRASTNVKGLTVNIPSSIAFKEQTAIDSMPLSPAQERWISMSVGGGVLPPAPEKESILSSSSTTVKIDNEAEKKVSMESIFDRRTGMFMRDDENDDFGFSKMNFQSPNPFPGTQPPSIFSSGFSTQNAPSLQSHHRSFSRGPQPRSFPTQQSSFLGMPTQQSSIPPEPARLSRSGNITNYLDRPFSAPKQLIPTSTRSSRENLQLPVNNTGPSPQYQQALWNVAGEIHQRQKDIETCGLRVPSRPTDMDRLLAKFESKEVSNLRFMLERGMLTERDMPRQTWNDLMNSGMLSNQSQPSKPTQYLSNSNVQQPNDPDCSCRISRPKYETVPFSTFFNQSHPQGHQQPNNFSQTHQQFYSQSHQHQSQPPQSLFRQPGSSPFGGSVSSSATPELSAPPKIFESLLPSDETFSIWLDPKPKKDGYIHLDNSSSDASLLTKMEVLRSDKFPISEEEMLSSMGVERVIPDSKQSSSGSSCSSPPVLSLMELLSSENLLDESSGKPKTTMFDFDTFRIAETLRATPAYSGQSSSCKSPAFYFMDEKTPTLDDFCSKPSGLYTPLTGGPTPSFMEQCDFFATAGSCPFGDGCQLSHIPPRDQSSSLQQAL